MGKARGNSGMYLSIVPSKDREAHPPISKTEWLTVTPGDIKFLLIPGLPAHRLSQLTQLEKVLNWKSQETHSLKVGSCQHAGFKSAHKWAKDDRRQGIKLCILQGAFSFQDE